VTPSFEQPSVAPPDPVVSRAVGEDAAAPTAALQHTVRPQRMRRLRHHRMMKASLAVLLVSVVVLIAVVGTERAVRPLAQPVIATVQHTSEVVPGTSPALPWPSQGQAAVAIPALGYAEQSGPEVPVPVASLAKMATAVVMLRDHPIPLGSSGPSILVNGDEAGQFGVDLANNETTIPLQAGESITELQLLQALMVASANDAAYTLAEWDAGSEAAFVAKMNGLATSLGAVHSHFVDSSGFQPQSISTATDMLRIAAAGMAIPTFAAVVDEPAATVPMAGVITNVVTLIGTNGIVGVKSGYTSQAAGCMVLAGNRTVAGRSVLVLAAALGQKIQPPPAAATTPPTAGAPTTTTVPYNALEAQYPLLYTGPLVEGLLYASEAKVTPVILTRSGQVVGTATAEWGGSRRAVPAVATTEATMLGVPGQRIASVITPMPHRGQRIVHDQVGSIRFTLGKETAVVLLARRGALALPDWTWKVLHG
jgi:D-alanyl-D-alanine carboxypeptidase (penicillin-binding protein 5/6)